MVEKLLNKLPFWRRLDETFLLRYPRLWQTRIHVAALFALMAYPLVFLFGAVVVRLWLTVSLGSLTSGQAQGSWYSINSMGDQMKFSYFLSQSILNGASAGSSILFYLGLLLFVISIVLWSGVLRGQRPYSIEQTHGKRQRGQTWLEWLSYLAVSAAFVGLPIWLMFSASSLPAQSQAAARIRQQTKASAIKYANDNGVDLRVISMPNGEIGNLSSLFYQSLPSIKSTSPPSFFDLPLYTVHLLVPDHITATTLITDVVMSPGTFPPVTSRSDWSLEAGNDEASQAYFRDLSGYAYESIFSMPTSWGPRTDLTGNLISIYRGLFFWWLVGGATLILFLSKRNLGRTSLVIVIGLFFLYPIILFATTMLMGFIWNFLFSSSASGGPNLLAIYTVVIGIPWLVLFLLGLYGTLAAAYQTRVYKPKFGIATAAFPLLLGMFPFIALVFWQASLTSSTSYTYGMPDDVMTLSYQISSYIPIALAAIPFLHVPLLPLIDRAATRLMSLPKEK